MQEWLFYTACINSANHVKKMIVSQIILCKEATFINTKIINTKPYG